MSHTPDDGAHATTSTETVSGGNSTPLSIVLFVVLFGLFCAGLYLLSLGFGHYSAHWVNGTYFLGGLGAVLVALFGTFTVVPKFLT
ncbi:hypothetical protein BRM3_14080 [Brachybacterium huguangmaarense]|uniref:Cell division protein CrgA n=1 Tax=Brachybacterium huguangmaarense TaxID=1652028 RepID=A0ABY6G1K5_9MICO|nr:hypothetical protein [Brachybacterium huguangmaarense]UYG16706.1 hypothetical protein BRM3_14080 [Brachybacterium huguangmaarense]